jgi:hypothetical protein
MKNYKSLKNRVPYLLLIIFSTASTVNSAPDSGGFPGINLLHKLMPSQFLVGPQLGMTSSKFMASSEYDALIRPTPSEKDFSQAPSFGLLLSARWKTGITLTVAPRRESHRLDTKKATVSFPGNPFPHTLKATTSFDYNVFPVMIGMGWFTHRQHFQVQLGTYAAFLDQGQVDWIVDGQPYSNTPIVQNRWTQTGFLMGTEYGFTLGAGELNIGIEASRQFHSMVGGLSGTLKVASARFQLAYLWWLKL